MLTIFSWAMIQEILCFTAESGTEGLFQFLAMVILAPRSIKKDQRLGIFRYFINFVVEECYFRDRDLCDPP